MDIDKLLIMYYNKFNDKKEGIALASEVQVKIVPINEIAYKEDTNWGMYACDTEKEDLNKVKLNRYGNIGVKGIMPRLDLYATYRVTLTEENHPKYGVSYQLTSIVQDLPDDPYEQFKYLKPLVTELQFKEFEKHYEGQKVVSLILDNKIDVEKLNGIGEVLIEKIKGKVENNMEFFEAMTQLSPFGIKLNQIVELSQKYGSAKLLVQKVKENPYILTELKGYGFKRADEVAFKMGIKREDRNRIKSCIKYVVKQAHSNGDSYALTKDVVSECGEMLGVSINLITECLQEGVSDVRIVDNKLTTNRVYESEKRISEIILNYQENSKNNKLNIDVDEFIERYQRKNAINFTEEQKSFFYKFAKNQVNLLIGYAGTGKSQIQHALVQMLKENDMTYNLLAPTGRASKQLSTYTGEEASTIHRRLGFKGKENDDELKTIGSDVVIVDEFSMADVFITNILLKQIVNNNVRIVFVGDPVQLPSVSVGSILRDLARSKKVATTILTVVFRQKEGGILDIATKVRNQEKFVDSNFYGKKQFGNDTIIHSVKQEFVEDGYIHYYKKALQKYNVEDIAVLTPTNKNRFGTKAINKNLQTVANDYEVDKLQIEYGDNVFRVGDIVMNLENTYDLMNADGETIDIFNGDTGIIEDIDIKNKKMHINYDGNLIEIHDTEFSKLSLAYSISFHKSQGSGIKCIILVLDKSSKYQLNANLIYTGVTRAKEELIIIGQAETINYGLRRMESDKRKSFLYDFMIGNI